MILSCIFDRLMSVITEFAVSIPVPFLATGMSSYSISFPGANTAVQSSIYCLPNVWQKFSTKMQNQWDARSDHIIRDYGCSTFCTTLFMDVVDRGETALSGQCYGQSFWLQWQMKILLASLKDHPHTKQQVCVKNDFLLCLKYLIQHLGWWTFVDGIVCS